MIIWGWRVRKKTIGTGVFFCPGEGGDRNYEHKQARRWFTIFFIPLIPLKELGDFVECTSCENTRSFFRTMIANYTKRAPHYPVVIIT